MKKLLFLSLTLIGIAGLASATPVTCSILMPANNGGSPGTTSVCTVTADAGSYISALTLTGTDDYTGYVSGTPTVTFGASLSQTGGLDTPFTVPTFCDVVTVGTSHSNCAFTTNPSTTVTNTNTGVTTYTLQLLNVVNTVTNGVVAGDSIVMNLDYATALIPTGPNGDAPEPATLGMMGGALMGLGLLARRKK